MEEIEVVFEEISQLLAQKKYRELKDILSELEPADVAIVFEELPKKSMPILFRLLAKEQAAEVFVELDSDMQEMLISEFSDYELKEVLEEFALIVKGFVPNVSIRGI